MRLFGHPIHPMLVHFPIAFWIAGAALDFLLWLGWVADPRLATWSLGLGLVSGAISVIPGFVDLVKLEERVVKTANIHASLMCISWLLFLGSFLVRFHDHNLMAELPMWILFLDAIAVIALAAGGAVGGELVHKHGVTLIRSLSHYGSLKEGKNHD